MAHVLLHYSLGVAVVTLPALGGLVGLLRERKNVATWLGKRLLAAHAIGLFAALPGLLPAMGISEPWCQGWWMNLFLFHPLIDQFKSGGALLAELAILALFALHYAMVLVAIAARSMDGRPT